MWRTLVALDETRSLTAAARRLGRSQPALSQRLAAIEGRLGVALFRRLRPLVPTEQGAHLAQCGRAILSQHEGALAPFCAKAPSGSICVAMPEYLAADTLKHGLRRLAASFPGLNVKLRVCASRVVLEALVAGEADLGFVTGDRRHLCEEAKRFDNELVRMCRFADEALVWVVESGSTAFRQRPLPLALFEDACLNTEMALPALEAAGLSYRVQVASTELSGVLAAAASGAAVAVVAARSARQHGLRVVGVAEGLPPLPSFGLGLYAASRRRVQLRPYVELLQQTSFA